MTPASNKATEAATVELTENARTVLERRYLRKDEEGHPVETPMEMFRRVAHNIAQAESNYEGGDPERREQEFLEVITSLKFMPNSPTLMNAGRELQQLSACFVLPVHDNMESIFEAVKHTALIHKSGGGTGFSFSRLRPANDVVQSTKGVSSGPVSFMQVFDSATEAIKQGGTRRGANMAVLRVDHPDIDDFVHAKERQDVLNNFNISVAIDEEWMQKVEKEEDYELVNPRNQEVVGTKSAKAVFEEIVKLAWKYGDPGIIFLDRINRDNPTPQVGQIESTNPCGEQPLLAYESCNLGSINLSKFVVRSNGTVGLDWEDLARTVHTAVRFLDNVIDMNNFPIPEIREMTKGNRKIGLGVMGWADTLIELGIPYDCEKALEVAEQVMAFIRDSAREASAQLAAERGVFPNFTGSIYNGPDGMKLRNATVTTIAPTGTISIIAGCSCGIEPLFAVCFARHVLDGEDLVEVNPIFERMAKEHGFHSEELMHEIAEHGSIQGMHQIPEEVRRLFVVAHDIAPEWHIRMQAAFQKYTDNAVSKTVNFANSATTEDVARVYKLAYTLGCKGVTIYRDGSRDEQVITYGKKEADTDQEGRIVPRGRPQVTVGTTRKMNTGCGNLYVTINSDDRGMFEVFTAMGKAGGCAASQNEAIGRLTSLALRSNVVPDAIIEQLMGISCHKPAWEQGGRILSCADAIAKAVQRCLQERLDTGQQEFAFEPVLRMSGACPECGGPIEHEGGCETCRACGFSECG
ncbi:MAG: vitamin B12-dependent ribonucleotide reductase [Armatimonadota bacterium]